MSASLKEERCVARNGVWNSPKLKAKVYTYDDCGPDLILADFLSLPLALINNLRKMSSHFDRGQHGIYFRQLKRDIEVGLLLDRYANTSLLRSKRFEEFTIAPIDSLLHLARLGILGLGQKKNLYVVLPCENKVTLDVSRKQSVLITVTARHEAPRSNYKRGEAGRGAKPSLLICTVWSGDVLKASSNVLFCKRLSK